MGQDLAGKVVIITGGASGIGRAAVELSVQHGAKVVIGDLNVEKGQALAAELGAQAAFLQTDVAKKPQIQALVEFAVSHFGGLDAIFNNAGMGARIFPDFLNDDLEDFQHLFEINLMGTVYGSQLAARHMAKNGGGVIINNASVAGVMPGSTMLAYRTAKAGVVHFSKSIAIAFAPHNIRVNVLAPGSLLTDITNFGDPTWGAEDTAKLRAETDVILRAYQPLQRQGRPNDAAEAFVFLASDRAAQITGILMPVDGGITAGDPENRAQQILDAKARVQKAIDERK